MKSKPSKQAFELLAETFATLGDMTRVQIVWALAQKPMYVNEIAEDLSLSQPQVSHHLRMLRNLRLVKVEREGRQAQYQLDDQHIEQLLTEGLEHVNDLIK